MKTRTLLLWALACGLAILVAGGVLLFQLAGQDEAAPPAAVGDEVQVGDMLVTVTSAVEREGVLEVAIRIGGVDDPDGAAGFRLIASGRPAAPVAGATTCGATTVEPSRCALAFDVATADGSSRVLVYARGDEQARWELGRP